jgi:hypothetical protein
MYVFTSALHVLGFLLAHLQKQVYDFDSGSSLLDMVSAPSCVCDCVSHTWVVTDAGNISTWFPGLRENLVVNKITSGLFNAFEKG